MKKFLSLTLALVLVLAACSVAAHAETGPLTVWWNIDNDVFRAYVDGFKQIVPDASLTYYPSEDLKTQTRLAVDSGSAPDVFQTNAGSIFQDFVAAGALMDLTDIINENNLLERINPDYIKPYTVNGRYYAFPTAPLTTWQNLYVNRDLLAQGGITEDPTTVDELIATCQKLTEAGIAPIAFGDKDGWPAILLLGDFFAQQVTDLGLVNQINAGDLKFADCTEFRTALDTLVKLGKSNVFMPGWKAADHTAAIQTFAAGQTAFLYNGSWWSNAVDDVENMGFELDIIWLPLQEGLTTTSSVQMSSDMCFVASANSANVDGIVKFLDFITTEECSALNAELNNSFSVYPGANEKINRAAVFNTEPILGQFEKPALGPFFDWVFPTPVTELLKVKIVECIDGTITIDQALEELQVEMDKNLNVMPPVTT